MDKPKTDEELAEYMEAVYLLAAREYIDKFTPRVSPANRDAMIYYMTRYTPFRNAVEIGFKCGVGEGFTRGNEYGYHAATANP